MNIKEFDFGKTRDGIIVKAATISNGKDCEFTVISRGATLASFKMKDNKGSLEELTLGFNTVEGYENHTKYYGATIGRIANRISDGKFTLDGKEYKVAINDSGANCLHGGIKGFDKVNWDLKVFNNGNEAGVELSYLSKDGEENFPGNLQTTIVYSLNDKREFTIDYKATTDKKTIVNLTNHAYWNLNGFKDTILKHKLQIEAPTYLPKNDLHVPTGEIKKVDSTNFDYRELTEMKDNLIALKGYDNTFNLSEKKLAEPKNRVYIEDPESGRSMEILTTEPGAHLYTDHDEYKFFCLEIQLPPNAINNNFGEDTILSPGEVYYQKTIHRFGIK